MKTIKEGISEDKIKHFLLFFFYKKIIGVQLICNVVLVSGVQKNESVISTYVHHKSVNFQIFFPHRPLKSIEQSSLCRFLLVIYFIYSDVDLTDSSLLKIIIAAMYLVIYSHVYVPILMYTNEINDRRKELGLFCYFKVLTLPMKWFGVV